MIRAWMTGTVIALAAGVSLGEPVVFGDRTYAAAKAQAAEAEKLLLVRATAVWCGPCKAMDRDTFSDEGVSAWIDANAVAVSVDVDDEPGVARDLRVRAMPTTILFRGEEELGRVVGYRAAEPYKAWLKAAKAGELEALEEQQRPRRPRPNAVPDAPQDEGDVRARLDRARALSEAERYDEATEEFAWLWENMLAHDRAMSGVRVSFMAGNMEQLAAAHAPARERFEALRNALTVSLGAGTASRADLGDWLVLNIRVLNEDQPVLAWIDRVKDRDDGPAALRRQLHVIDDVLIRHERWALMGELTDPQAELRHARSMLTQGEAMARRDPDRFGGDLVEVHRRMFRDDVALIHAALLAAERDAEAFTIARESLKTLDDIETRRALLQTAKRAGELTRRHLGLLDEDNPAHADLVAMARAAIRG